jgi:hypothetical protein
MKKIIAIAFGFAFVVAIAIFFLSDTGAEALKIYASSVRHVLFTGLLTVGSFLLSLKVFIVVKYKETFDSAEYKQRLKELRELDPNLEHYTQVRNLSSVLFAAISSTLTASFLQVTVGLISHPLAMLAAVGAAAFAAAMLAQTLWLIRSVLSEWLDHMEVKPEAEKK